MTMQTNPNPADAGQGGETPPAATRGGLLEASATDLLSEGLTPPDPAADGDEDEEDAPPAATPPAADSSQGAPTPARPAAGKPSPEQREAAWVAMLAEDPARASEVPEAARESVVAQATTLRTKLYNQASEQILEQLRTAQTRQAAVAERIATFVELEEAGDLEALAELEQSDAQGAQLYHQVKAQAAALRAPGIPPEVQQLKDEARELVTGLTPEQAAEIRTSYAAGKYPTSVKGLMALRTDVDAMKAPRTPRTPAQRQAAASARAALPRVDASEGEAPAPRKTTRKELLETSDTDLLSAGLKEAATALSTP